VKPDFQTRVSLWVIACFGERIARDRTERNHRFLEEALELAQSSGCTEDEALQLVKYVFSRPLGEPSQEVGGVMLTLAALCNASELNMDFAAEAELERVWEKIEKIRLKRTTRLGHLPLP